MHRTRHLLFSLALILVPAISVHADEVDDYIKTAMASMHIPGASIAVIKDGSLIKAEAYGLADLENVLTNRQGANMEGLTANIATRVVPQLRTTPAPTK